MNYVPTHGEKASSVFGKKQFGLFLVKRCLFVLAVFMHQVHRGVFAIGKHSLIAIFGFLVW